MCPVDPPQMKKQRLIPLLFLVRMWLPLLVVLRTFRSTYLYYNSVAVSLMNTFSGVDTPAGRTCELCGFLLSIHCPVIQDNSIG